MPGPWRAEQKDGVVVIWSDSLKIAEVVGLSETDLANARLIKASPKLLAACKHAIDALEHGLAVNFERFYDAVDEATKP
jgi:hypothetical protein